VDTMNAEKFRGGDNPPIGPHEPVRTNKTSFPGRQACNHITDWAIAANFKICTCITYSPTPL